MRNGRRVVRNTGIRIAAEVVGKLAVVVLFAVIARELGRQGFGDFAFALSLAFLLTNLTSLGIDVIVTRDVASNDNPELANRARSLRSHGSDVTGGSVLGSAHSRLDELQAALLLAKLPHLEGWTARRRDLARQYLNALDGRGLILPREATRRAHAFHLFVVRSSVRDRLRKHLAQRGVETLVHYPRAIHQHPAYAELGVIAG